MLGTPVLPFQEVIQFIVMKSRFLLKLILKCKGKGIEQ